MIFGLLSSLYTNVYANLYTNMYEMYKVIDFPLGGKIIESYSSIMEHTLSHIMYAAKRLWLNMFSESYCTNAIKN